MADVVSASKMFLNVELFLLRKRTFMLLELRHFVLISMVGADGTSLGFETKSLGPHGLGDPDDRTLRKVEIEVMIPKRMREKAKIENCLREVQDFQKCCKENGISLILSCQKENAKMKECLSYWYQNPEFQSKCKEEYLDERAEYRRTGIGKKKVVRM